MEFIATATSSYQPLFSLRRRSSVASNTSSSTLGAADSAPILPVDSVAEGASKGGFMAFESAVQYTYTCDKCGFGTNLLSSYMPHASNPCDQPATITWGQL
ncbi:hypothetical protein GGI04_005149, partial [Coemansia thaxteri]